MLSQRYKDLCKEMSDHTKCECGGPGCKPFPIGRCCTIDDCSRAMVLMDELNVDLSSHIVPGTEGFLSATGCTLQPWQRPICTWHTCQINNLGYKTKPDGSIDWDWTNHYFALRDSINHEIAKTPIGSIHNVLD